MCIDYRKLNKSTKKDHFPLPFIDEMLERLANHSYFAFSMDSQGSCKFPFTRMINRRQHLLALMECLYIEGCPSGYAMLQPLFYRGNCRGVNGLFFHLWDDIHGLLGKLRQGSHEVCGGRSSAKLGKVPLHGKVRHSAWTRYIRERN
jgi:hypothetical protein